MKYRIYYNEVLVAVLEHDAEKGYRYLPNMANINADGGILKSLFILPNANYKWELTEKNIPPLILERINEDVVESATDSLRIEVS